ncbi:MAG: tetratricopeptide repeat protein [Flavobacteriales bacterium]|jgi:Tfp pilus assembly protein PilF|nr:tetratricopeptide repeat protein [Flavobacteriales bacterium]
MRHAPISRSLPVFGGLLLVVACGTDPDPAAGIDEHTPLAEIDRRIVEDPGNALLYAERARYHERVDSAATALNDWRRAIQLDSTNASLHMGLGDLLFRLLRVEEAERSLVKASLLDPRATVPMLRLAELRLIQRRYPEAMDLTNNVLRIDLHNALAYHLKGWVHMEAGDTALAVSSFRTAIEQDPYMVAPYVQLGALFAVHHDPMAMEYYSSALEIDPQNVEALYGMGMYAQENGLDSLAMANYARIKELAPHDPHAWYNTGYILMEHRNDPVAARPQFARAMLVAPEYTEAYYNLGVTYERTGQLDSALVWYKRSLGVDPAFTAAAQGLSRLQSKGARVVR